MSAKIAKTTRTPEAAKQLESEKRQEAPKSHGFKDLQDLISGNPALQKIYIEVDLAGLKRIEKMQRVVDMVAEAIGNSNDKKERAELKIFLQSVREVIERAGGDPEADWDAANPEVATPRQAENKIIDYINNKSGEQIISGDGPVSLKWFVDEQTPNGRFAIVQHGVGHKPGAGGEGKKKYVLEKDEETGEMYKVEKMSGPVSPQNEDSVSYELTINQVKDALKYNPDVKKKFTEGLNLLLQIHIDQVKELQARLKLEKRPKGTNELNTQIAEHKLDQEKIEKELQAIK